MTTKMMFLTPNDQKREKRKRRCRLFALCLGKGVLAVLFMARLLAALPPKCPDRSQTQLPSFLISAAFKTL